MTRTIQVMLAVAAVAFFAGAMRFVPAVGLPRALADFCGGFGAGVLIGAIVTWVGGRTPPGQP